MVIRIAFVINGTRKLNQKAKMAIDLAKVSTAFSCSFSTTLYAKHAVEIAKHHVDDGVDIIVAVGGDGTGNEVLNGIQLSEQKGDVIMGIIPNGTGNDFHKMIGEFDPEKFINSLIKLNSRKIDLISIHHNDKKWFSLNIAGIGFDGHVVNSLNNMRSFNPLSGKIDYPIAILRSFLRFRKSETIITSDTFCYAGKTLMMAVCNGKAFGHGLIISPDSILDDGLLDIVLLGDVSFLDYVRNLSRLKRGVKIHHKNVHYFKTKRVRITMPNDQLYCETDGEILGQGDAVFEVLPSRLKLLD